MKVSSLIFTALPLVSAHIHARAADGVVTPNTFNYTNLGGPLNWYGLNTTANDACAKGTQQSPIDIGTAADPVDLLGRGRGHGLAQRQTRARVEALHHLTHRQRPPSPSGRRRTRGR